MSEFEKQQNAIGERRQTKQNLTARFFQKNEHTEAARRCLKRGVARQASQKLSHCSYSRIVLVKKETAMKMPKEAVTGKDCRRKRPFSKHHKGRLFNKRYLKNKLVDEQHTLLAIPFLQSIQSRTMKH